MDREHTGLKLLGPGVVHKFHGTTFFPLHFQCYNVGKPQDLLNILLLLLLVTLGLSIKADIPLNNYLTILYQYLFTSTIPTERQQNKIEWRPIELIFLFGALWGRMSWL